MKAAPFEYARPASLAEAISLLAAQAGTRACWPADSRWGRC